MYEHREDPAPIPARVLLSSLVPIGVGTVDCESLPSYVGRLAAIHGVSSVDLIEYVRSLPRIEGENYRLEVGPRPYCGNTPGLFGVRLARLTGVPSVAVLGMPWADFTIAFRKHVRRSPAWCSTCWREDIEAGRPKYHRLLWSFDLNSRCARHGTRLESACPACGSAAKRGAKDLPAADGCWQCGSDLLDAAAGARSPISDMAAPSIRSAHCEQLFADLVAQMPSLGEVAHWPDIERAVELIRLRSGLTLQMDVFREVRTNVIHLHNMRRPERIRTAISISAVLKLAAGADLTIMELLQPGGRKGEFE